MYQRNISIDYLRVLGTFLVMLAHVLPPNIIQNVRTFDVVMLVYISALSMNISYKPEATFKDYLVKRIRRLYVPTAMLLIVLFVLSFLTCSFVHRQQLFDIKTVVHSFLLLEDGLGYIWITRVYLLIAIFSFFVMRYRDNMYVIWGCFAFIIAGIFVLPYLYGVNVVTDSYVVIPLPYLLITLIGLLVANRRINKKIVLVICFAIVLAYSIYNGAFIPNDFKYPPSLYYLSYGVTCTMILQRIPFVPSYIIEWLSKNSFNIYLLHIPFLLGVNFLGEYNAFFDIWYVKYLIVCLFSVAILLCFILCKKFYEKNR